MSMPYYVAPEQAMTDRADFARKGIAKGRALVAPRYEHGIVLVAENTSQSLRCLLYTSPSPRDLSTSRMPSSA